MKGIPVAYQLYSAREEFAHSPQAVFKELASLGYRGVEFAGLYSHTPSELRKMLDDAGLAAISAHVPLQTMKEDIFSILSDYARLGCEYITIPRLNEFERPGGEGFSKTIALLFRFGHLARQAGMTLLFHNHFCEFARISGQYGLDFLYDAVPRDLLQTQLDVCWIDYAGEDPLAYLYKYQNRCPVVHLKDYIYRKGDISPYEWEDLPRDQQAKQTQFVFCPWGYGSMDGKPIVKAAIACGAKWFVIEQDYPWQGIPLQNAQQAIHTLQNLYHELEFEEGQ